MVNQIKICIPKEIGIKDISSILYKPESGFIKNMELPIKKNNGFRSSIPEIFEFTGILVNAAAFVATIVSIAMIIRNRENKDGNKLSAKINIKTGKDENVEIDLLNATDIEIETKIKSLEVKNDKSAS